MDKFVCQIQRAFFGLLAFYATMPQLPGHKGLDVCDFVQLERKRFHAALEKTDRVGPMA